MNLSRYAIKHELRALKREVSNKTGMKISALESDYQKWLNHQAKTVGRATPMTRTEEIASELIWLRSRAVVLLKQKGGYRHAQRDLARQAP